MIVGVVIILICGAVLLGSTFLPWISNRTRGITVSLTGWQTKDFVDNKFFDIDEGKPLFTGMCSLIAGGLLVLMALLILLTRSKVFGVLAMIFSLLALGMSGANLYSFISLNFSMGVGIYLFIASSIIGVVGSIVSIS